MDVVSLFSNMARRFRTPPDMVIDGKEFPYKYSGCVVGRACTCVPAFSEIRESPIKMTHDGLRKLRSRSSIACYSIQQCHKNVRGWLR